MLVLFDQGTPRGIARWLTNHTVKEAKSQGWDKLTNGELLRQRNKLDLIYCLLPTRIFVISRTLRAVG
jgi:hypothetical protein